MHTSAELGQARLLVLALLGRGSAIRRQEEQGGQEEEDGEHGEEVLA